MDDLISVIMSTYNEDEEWLKDSIESVLNQTYKNLQFIIVLDNPQNTNIKELLLEYKEKDKRIEIIFNPKNIGLVESLNMALKQCKGKYVARMDADDISLNNRLTKEKEFLEKNNFDFIYSGMIIIDEKGKKVSEWVGKELDFKQIRKLLGIRNISIHPTWFVKKEVYTNLNGYRAVPYCEDYDFSLRALKRGYKIGKINENLLMYRVRGNSISRSNVFEQFLYSNTILSLYKKNRLEDNYYFLKALNKVNQEITEYKRKKFLNAEKFHLQGTDLIRKGKYLVGSIKILKSIFTSKYYVIRILDITKYKINSFLL